MEKITYQSFHSEGLLAGEDQLDFMAQWDIFSHRFDILPDMIRQGELYNLDYVTLDLLASYLEGKVKTVGRFKRPADKTKTYNIFMVGKLYEELSRGFQHERQRLLFKAICDRCDLVDSNGKRLSKRNIREYIDQYLLDKSGQNRMVKMFNMSHITD